jgi:hypothetical protein
VAYFVKAVLRNENTRNAATRLGLPVTPLRFAIVDAYVANNAQAAIQNVSLREPAVMAVASALVKARLLETQQGYIDLLAKAQQSAALLAMNDASKAHLRTPAAEAGTLRRLAIPLSSNMAWYHQAANWVVAPLCRIDPRLSKISMQVDGGAMKAAVNRITATKMYFVHTYSWSNSRMLRVTRYH